MELSKIELAVVEEQANAAADQKLHELSELQLAFVGGGIAELVGC